ncbi:MAG: hypothetical protein HYV63_32610 [Candidatus Schekmanbacteria bacterium]|nr:hypothetical protein [Candidatus Schekmanbacteria bacterium]
MADEPHSQPQPVVVIAAGMGRDESRPSDVGRIIVSVWTGLAERFSDVVTDAFVVVPDHVHGIIGLNNRAGSSGRD